MRKVLTELLSSLNSYGGELSYSLQSIKRNVENQLTLIELSDKLGSNIPEYCDATGGCVDLHDPFYLIEFGPHRQARITWPDCGRQPDAGWYLRVCFPTGAYILNNSYPEKSFNNMFQELKDFSADYTDTANHGLYFKLGEAPSRKVFKAYKEIYQKYYTEGRAEVLAKEIAHAEKSLEKLRNCEGH